MSKKWISFLKDVELKTEKLKKEGHDFLAFRGQSKSKWDLTPSLFVCQERKGYSDEAIKNIESRLYFDFVTDATPLIGSSNNLWETLFEMRHHGVPTRILDWTEIFGVALFFALVDPIDSPCIWILDAYELNRISTKEETIPNPITDLDFDYKKAYIDDDLKDKPFNDSIAIVAPRSSKRHFVQRGLFTLQGLDNTPINLNSTVEHCVSKFDVPLDCIDEARKFLKLAGIDAYSVFPDLDGLAKKLILQHEL